jgi:hypothetical protein
MNTTLLTYLLQLAGGLHLGLICAGATMPRAVNLREHLRTLPPFIRRLFLVYFVFIGFILVCFGTLTFLFANAMAMGEPVARALCVVMLMFWFIRLIAGAVVFDVRPYLTNWFYRSGYVALNTVFLYLLSVYAIAAWMGGRI